MRLNGYGVIDMCGYDSSTTTICNDSIYQQCMELMHAGKQVILINLNEKNKKYTPIPATMIDIDGYIKITTLLNNYEIFPQSAEKIFNPTSNKKPKHTTRVEK